MRIKGDACNAKEKSSLSSEWKVWQSERGLTGGRVGAGVAGTSDGAAPGLGDATIPCNRWDCALRFINGRFKWH